MALAGGVQIVVAVADGIADRVTDFTDGIAAVLEQIAGGVSQIADHIAAVFQQAAGPVADVFRRVAGRRASCSHQQAETEGQSKDHFFHTIKTSL